MKTRITIPGLFKNLSLAMPLAAMALSSAAQASSSGEPRHSGKILVKMKASSIQSLSASSFVQSRIESAIGVSPRALGVERIAAETIENLHLVTVGQGSSFAAALESLKADPNVEYAEPDYVITADFGGSPPTPTPPAPTPKPTPTPTPTVTPPPATGSLPNDPSLANQWHLTGTFGAGASALWKTGITGTQKIIVAIVDTGVDYTHPDLSANMYTNPGESGSKATDGADNDGNGFIDDSKGYNFAYGTNDPLDDDGHGTHVAGIIGASGNNGIGVSGVNWNTTIMPVKFMDASGSGNTSDGISGINYAVLMGAKVINCSWGSTGFSQALKDAIANAGKAGVLVIAAAGNDGANTDTTPQYPGAYTGLSNLITVAATDINGNMASFSNYGAQTVHVAAPGLNIYSTYPNKQYKYLSGTSMATPVVAGTAAIVWSQDPTQSYSWVRDRIVRCGTPLAAGVQSRTPVSSGLLVNAYNAYYGKNCK